MLLLTPEEVTARRFLVSLRGYDRDEVHAFLDQVAEDLRAARARIDELEGTIGAAASGSRSGVDAQPARPDPGAVFAGIGRETERILEAAHAAAAEIVQHAREEADTSLSEVHQQVSEELADGQRRLNAIEESLHGLAASRSEVAGELRDVQRTIEHVLRDLVPPDEHTVSMREALAAQARAQLRDAPVPGENAASVEPPAATRLEPPSEAAQSAPPDTEEPSEGGERPAERIEQPSPATGPEVEPDEAAPTGAEITKDHPEVPDPDVPGAREDAGALRSEVLGPLHPRMSRSVKRGLQDLQNRLLSVVQGADELPEPDEALFGTEELDGLADLVDEELQRAYRAGADAAQVLADGAASTPNTVRNLAREFARHAAERFRSPLAATLRLGLGAGEQSDELSERITAVFTELRASTAAELAATHLIRAYELGLLDAWTAGETAARRWVQGPEARCPENRCEVNERAGVIALGDVFPSGHEAPPVHVGCTCTTVPEQKA